MSGGGAGEQHPARGKSRTYFELLDGLKEPGCAVCQLVDRSVRQRIDVFFYEQLNVIERRAEIREARGFCSFHGSMVPGHGRMVGAAVVYQDVLNATLRDLNAALPRRGTSLGARLGAMVRLAAKGARDAIRPRRPCVLCDYEREQETIYLHTLAREMKDKAMHDAFKASSGVCLPHFAMALGLGDVAAESLAAFIEIERDLLEKLKADIDEYVRKSNGSYDFDTMGPEADAPLRATRMVSGRVIHADGR